MLSKEEEIIPESHLKNEWHAASHGRKHFNEIAGMELINFLLYLIFIQTAYQIKLENKTIVTHLLTDHTIFLGNKQMLIIIEPLLTKTVFSQNYSYLWVYKKIRSGIKKKCFNL
jgi:hypothetical protein